MGWCHYRLNQNQRRYDMDTDYDANYDDQDAGDWPAELLDSWVTSDLPDDLPDGIYTVGEYLDLGGRIPRRSLTRQNHVWSRDVTRDAVGGESALEDLEYGGELVPIHIANGAKAYLAKDVCMNALGLDHVVTPTVVKSLRRQVTPAVEHGMRRVLAKVDEVFGPSGGEWEAEDAEEDAVTPAVEHAMKELMAAYRRFVSAERLKTSKEHIMKIVERLARSSYNHVKISQIGLESGMSPDNLLPIIDALRREGKLAGSALEGRARPTALELSYQTRDGVGIVSVRD
jgi:hypothetical protein